MPGSSSDYAPLYQAAGAAHNVDPTLLAAIGMTEDASGNPNAVSSAGAQGVAQLMPATASALGVQNPDDPSQAIPGQAALVAQNLARYKDPRMAVAAYFGGTNQANWGPKTNQYVAEVAKNYATLKAQKMATPAAQQQSSGGSDLVNAFLSVPASGSAPAPSSSATQPATAAPSGSDLVNAFLTHPAANSNAPAAQTALAPPQPSASSATPPVPYSGAPMGGEVAALGHIGSAAVQGAKQGFGSAPIGVSPQATAALQRIGIEPPANGGGTPMQYINRAAINTVAPYVDTAMRGANALFSGAQAGVAQAGTEVGQPLLGRDLAALPEAFAGSAPEVGATENALTGASREAAPAAAPVRNALTAPASRVEPRLVPQIGNELANAPPTGVLANLTDAINKVGPDMPLSARATAAHAGVGPAPSRYTSATPDAAAQPRSVGAAATPAETTAMTPAEAASNEAADNQDRLTSRPRPGDDTIYVPGSVPTQAEVDANAESSLRQKQHMQTTDPQGFAVQQAQNNDARVDLYRQVAGNPDSLRIANENLDQVREQGQAAAFANKGEADPEPVQDTIKGILSSPAGIRPAVQSAMKSVQDVLTGPDGNLRTDPEDLYAVRQHIGDLLSKQGLADNPSIGLAKSQLLQVRDALDQAIEPAAPGFKQYLSDYAAAARPIDAMEYLQQKLPEVMNGNGMMSYPKFNNMMKQIGQQRTMGGVNPAKSIDPETLQQLWNIHSDLKRTTNLDLGRARGSDTSQNLSMMQRIGGLASAASKNLAWGGAHAVAATHLPFVGNAALQGVKDYREGSKAAKAQNALIAESSRMLHPPGPTQANNLLTRYRNAAE